MCGITQVGRNLNKENLTEFFMLFAIDKNSLSILKPTRGTNISNLFYFGTTLHVSDGLSFPSSAVQDCTYSNQTDTAVCMLASRQQYLFDKCLLLYVQP
jgi:hypothetical protein